MSAVKSFGKQTGILKWAGLALLMCITYFSIILGFLALCIAVRFGGKRLVFLLLGVFCLRLIVFVSWIVYSSHTDGVPSDSLLFVGAEGIGKYEAIIYGKYREAKESKAMIDPFTGRDFLEHDSALYSIGPDLEDQKLEIAYDPTNGIISSGDIRVHRP